jgi:glycosyltransferase involved in cell wall biosynthesis
LTENQEVPANIQCGSVEVLLPVRAPAPWLEDTLRGLERQTLRDFDIRVMLHGTDDAGIRALVHSYFPRASITYVTAEATFSELLNVGLQESSAEFVARLDADDIPHPDRLTNQRDFLAMNHNICLVASDIMLIDKNGTELGVRSTPGEWKALLKALRWKNVIPHPSVMFRRHQVLAVGGYSTRAKHAEDYELWLNLAAQESFAVAPIPLTFYRLHPRQVSRASFIGAQSSAAVLEARLRLARSRGESQIMVRFRHATWSIRQILRRLGSRTA